MDTTEPRPQAIFLMGPTAAGKSEAAIRLCDELPLEIVSVDSSLVYRGLNIGSAKPPPSVLQHYPHQLVDICEPHETYSAANFRRDALACIAKIHRRGNTPLLVGGTGLYFRTLERGIAELPEIPADLREQLRDECAQRGSVAMHRELDAVDPQSAARIHPNDPQRILRALEVFRASGISLSAHFAMQSTAQCGFSITKIVYAPAEKARLHDPISRRFEQMLAAGFVNEVIKLRQDSRLSVQTPSLRAVGYRAVWQFLDGRISRQQMVHDGIVATRRLAKRQYTWFRGEANCRWVDPFHHGSFAELHKHIKREVFSA